MTLTMTMRSQNTLHELGLPLTYPLHVECGAFLPTSFILLPYISLTLLILD